MEAGERRKLVTAVRSRMYSSDLKQLQDVLAKAVEMKVEEIPKDREGALIMLEGRLDACEKDQDGGSVFLTEVLGAFDVKPESETPKTTEDTKVVWRQDFKIIGQIGDTPNCISYINLLRQIETGLGKGYKENDILSTVIRAIIPTCKLKGYLEGRNNLNLDTLQKILRSFYNEKTSTELYQELCTLTQNSRETVQEFLYRGLELRQKILFQSKGSEVVYQPSLVETQFKHAIATGLREDSIRLEVQVLLNKFKDDEELIQGVNSIAKDYSERQQKLNINKKTQCLATEATQSDKVLLELKALRAEVNEMKKQFHNKENRNYSRCARCEQQGSTQRCNHCFQCGSTEHRQRQCPKQGNGRGSHA